MVRVIPEPDVTTKQGRLKLGKSRPEPQPTVEDLAKLEVLDEVLTYLLTYLLTPGLIFRLQIVSQFLG